MASKKHGLGKGLDALFGNKNETAPQAAEQPAAAGTPLEIELDKIVAAKDQPRKTFDEVAMKELAASVMLHGVVTPVILRKLEDGKYELVAGERRCRAAKMAGLKTVPAVIKEYGDAEMSEVALIENIQRRDLTPIEEAKAYVTLMETYGLTQEKLATRVGRGRSLIANLVRLLELPQIAIEALENGSLSVGNARPILAIAKEENRIAAAEEIMAKGLSARAAEALCARLAAMEKKEAQDGGKKTESLAGVDELFLKESEDKLKLYLGTIAHIKLGQKKSRIEIEVSSREELERVLGILSDRHESDVESKKEALRAASRKFTI
ncbi:MAG: ParB/RepB/Spo0J family partition protein [Selenomonadaceae bacterium]|nr:ParB/RepB/Spo0J family partition protein [Selenomonadaceae bacterium]